MPTVPFITTREVARSRWRRQTEEPPFPRLPGSRYASEDEEDDYYYDDDDDDTINTTLTPRPPTRTPRVPGLGPPLRESEEIRELDHLGAGVIAAIVVSVAVFFVIAIGLILFFHHRRKSKKKKEAEAAVVAAAIALKETDTIDTPISTTPTPPVFPPPAAAAAIVRSMSPPPPYDGLHYGQALPHGHQQENRLHNVNSRDATVAGSGSMGQDPNDLGSHATITDGLSPARPDVTAGAK
ncbi:hypothetical protein VTJ04DRAFT_4186 [Mycothermus thermophilus]|uniref:uncharacterized protein n=1 Tax=Humicola insolens TaxID=85995 RepID=UPI0037432DF8